MNKVLVCWDSNCCLTSHLSQLLPILRRTYHTKRTLLTKVYVKKDIDFTIIPPPSLQPNHNNDVHTTKYNHHNNHGVNGHSLHQNGANGSNPRPLNGHTHQLPIDSPPPDPPTPSSSLSSPSSTPPITASHISSSHSNSSPTPALDSKTFPSLPSPPSHFSNTSKTPPSPPSAPQENVNLTSPLQQNKQRHRNKQKYSKPKHTNTPPNFDPTTTTDINNTATHELNNPYNNQNPVQQPEFHNFSPEFYYPYYYYQYPYQYTEAFNATSFPPNTTSSEYNTPSNPPPAPSSTKDQFPLPLRPRPPKPPPKLKSPPLPPHIQELSRTPLDISVNGFNEKIATAVRAGHLKSCLELFDKMKTLKLNPTTHTFELLITAYVGTPAARNANLLFSELLSFNVKPSSTIYEKLLIINSKLPHFCDKIYAHMRNDAGIAPDACVARTLILAHFTNSRNIAHATSRAREVLADLLANNNEGTPIPPDVFNILIEHVDENEGSELYASMGAHGVRPDVSTFNTILSKNQGKGEARVAREEMILAEMHAQGVAFNLVTFNVLISNATRRKDLARAIQLFEEMKAKKIDPDIVTYQQLTLNAARMGEHDYCWQLMQEMREAGWS